jgi:hypothetical protein
MERADDDQRNKKCVEHARGDTMRAKIGATVLAVLMLMYSKPTWAQVPSGEIAIKACIQSGRQERMLIRDDAWRRWCVQRYTCTDGTAAAAKIIGVFERGDAVRRAYASIHMRRLPANMVTSMTCNDEVPWFARSPHNCTVEIRVPRR